MRFAANFPSSNNKLTVIKAKLRPRSFLNAVFRPRLLESVKEEKDKPLVVINAGAGYGKTTFLAQLYSSLEGTSIWHSLDERDNDSAFFLSHLLAGAEQQIAGIGECVSSSLSPACDMAEEKQQMLASLVNGIIEKGSRPVYFFFDDFHKVNGSASVTDAVRFLLEYLPEGSRMFVAGREKPNLPLARLRARRALLEIGMEELRFSLDETIFFFKSFSSDCLTDRQIIKLHSQLEGWPAALGLSKYTEEGARENAGEWWNLDGVRRYLTDEVWPTLDSECRLFLMQSSLLDPVDPEICDRVLNPGETAVALLRKAEERNLMTSRMSGSTCYSFHPLFRDFLSQSLMAEFGPAAVKELHFKYAEALLDSGRVERAVDRFFSAGEIERAVAAMESCGAKLLESGDSKTMSGWLEKIPETFFDKHAWLYYFRAVLYERYGNLREALESIEQAERGFKKARLRAGLCIAVAARAEMLTDSAKYQPGLKAAEAGLKLAEGPAERGTAMCRLAYSHLLLGRKQAAVELLDEARELYDEALDETGIGIATLNLRYLAGDFCGILADTDSLIKMVGQVDLMRDRFSLLIYRASALFESARYQDSLDLLAEAKNLLGGEHHGFDRAFECLRGQNLLYAGDVETGRKKLWQLVEDKSEHRFLGPDCPLNQLGAHARQQGRSRRALEIHNEVLMICRKEGTDYSIASVLQHIGGDKVGLRDGKDTAGEPELREAYAIADAGGYQYVKSQIHFQLARLAMEIKNEKQAIAEIGACLDLASRYSHTHFLVQEGRNSLGLLSLAFEHGLQRDYLTEVLGNIGSLRILSPFINSKCPETRKAAIKATAAVGGPRAASLLRVMTRDRDADVSKAAKESLKALRAGIGSPDEVLTEREMEVLALMADGLSNKVIGKRLYISEATVKAHITRIFNKLYLTKRTQAASYFHPAISGPGGAE